MLVRWTKADPAERVWGSWTNLNRLFDDAFGLNGSASRGLARAWMPAVDVAEDEKAYSIAVELPGVNPDDVGIQLEGNRLTIRLEQKAEADDTSGRVHRFERSYGSFERSFMLPETVDSGRIEARADHGVLTITVPKSEKAQPRRIPVRAS